MTMTSASDPARRLMLSRRRFCAAAGASAGFAGEAHPARAELLTGLWRRRSLNCAYVGVELSGLTAFETFLGRQLDGVQTGSWRADTTDYLGSIRYALAAPQVGSARRPGPLLLTMEMFCDPKAGFGTESLASVADGLYDHLWATNAAYVSDWMKSHRPHDRRVFIRFGEEMNGSWMPWAVSTPGDPGRTKANAAAYVAAYRRMWRVYKANDPRGVFRFEWCPGWSLASQPWAIDTEICYPGDAFVDVCGLDVYWMVKDSGMDLDPVKAFAALRDDVRGLAWLEAFAAAHRKPTAYHEWGQGQDGAGFIVNMADWIKTHRPLFHGWWDKGGMLESGAYPKAAAAYRAAFGRA
jgi:hypothetical protein